MSPADKRMLIQMVFAGALILAVTIVALTMIGGLKGPRPADIIIHPGGVYEWRNN